MKCPHCNTYVTKIPVNWKCPHCGERLPEPGYWSNFFEGLSEYLLEKGAIFWGIVFAALLIMLGSVEMIFGRGFLLSYIGHNFLFAFVMIFFAGMLIDMYMKIVLPLRVPYGSDFIVRERAVIRNIRKASHVAGILSIVICLVWLGPRNFMEYFPSYLVILGWFLAMSWAIAGLYLDVKMVDDIRFRYYMERLGITGLKRFRRICTVVIGALFMIAVVYFIMMNIPELPQKISNWSVLAVFVHFAKNYLSWII